MNLSAELSATRRALHAVAELLIAGPQYAAERLHTLITKDKP